MDQAYFMSLPGLEQDELTYLQSLVKDMSDLQQKNFFMIYQGKRKDPQTILICSIVGLVFIPGLQRFLLGQIGMGILYLLTFGLCFIGSIVDLVNNKKMTLEYNQKAAYESANMSRSFAG